MDINSTKEFGKLLKNAAKNDFSELVEFGLDEIIQEETIKQFPVIPTLVGISNFVSSLKNAFFVKKCCIFLNNFENGNINIAFRSTVFNNPKKFEKFIEVLLLCIEKYSDKIKIELLSNCAYSYLSEDIDFITFNDFLAIIDRLLISDIKNIEKIMQGNTENWSTGCTRLENLELIEKTFEARHKLLMLADSTRKGKFLSTQTDFEYQCKIKILEKQLLYSDFQLTDYGTIFYNSTFKTRH